MRPTRSRHYGVLACALLASLLCLLSPASARAGRFAHYDLVSLVFESHAIVRVQAIDEGRYRVIESIYVHSIDGFAPGDVVELDTDEYMLAPRDAPADWDPEPEILLFSRAKNVIVDGHAAWGVVPSGMRIVEDGLVYRYEWDRSAYAPVVQGHDPYDVFHDPRAGSGLSPEEFELELDAAIEHVEWLRSTLAGVDEPGKVVALLDFLGPPMGLDDDEPFPIGPSFDRLEDPASAAVIRELSWSSDLDTTLEGVSRLRLGVAGVGVAVAAADELLEYARDRGKPVARRVAALGLLVDRSIDDEQARAAVQLLTEPEPRVRAAAADLRSYSPEWRAAIAERLELETDQGVLYELLEVALNDTDDARASVEWSEKRWPAIRAERRGRAIELRVGSRKQHYWDLIHAHVEARSAAAAPRELVVWPAEDASWWIAVAMKGDWSAVIIEAALLPDPPLPEGRIELELVARFRKGQEIRERRIALPPLRPQLGPAPAEPIEPTPPPPGCACTADTPGNPSGWWLLACLAALARRRTHRCRCASA